ncbi:MAG: O-antigen ligase family protein [Anaerolineae bacterium]|nr:O-antigen ligase family protein [Anaerolineae bacterium]
MIQRRSLETWNDAARNGLGILLALACGVLLTQFPLADTLLLVFLFALALGTLGEPLVGLVGGLFLGLFRAYLQSEVPQIPAQIGHLYVALAAASWAMRGLAQRDLRVPHPPLLLPLLGFVGAAWLSLWSAVDLMGYGLPEFAKWIEMLVILLLVAERVQPRHLPWLLGALLLIGSFQAGVGIYQSWLRGTGPAHFQIPDSDLYRAYGTFEQPNPYAGYIGMTLALASGWAGSLIVQREKGAKSALLTYLLVTAALLAAALAASWSRGAWIGFAAAAATMALALPRRTHRGLLLLALLALVALLLYAAGLLPPSIVARLTDFAADLRLQDVRGVGITDANYAVIERLAHWQAALEMWRDHFWRGVGLGCYEPAYAQFALVNWPYALGHAHNVYLNLLAETGLIGLAAYVLFWGAVFWQTWRVTRRTSGLVRGIAIGLLGAWTHLAVHHLFDNLYVNNVHLFVGLLLGALTICGHARAVHEHQA